MIGTKTLKVWSRRRYIPFILVTLANSRSCRRTSL